MSRRTRFALVGVVIAAAVAVGLATGNPGGGVSGSNRAAGQRGTSGVRPRTIDPALNETLARAGRSARLPFAEGGNDEAHDVTIEGTVVDARSGEVVGGVEVVFRNEAGEQTVMAGADGRYSILVRRGTYHAFVRDETVLSVGRSEVSRLPTLPSADVAGVPDEGLMPIVRAVEDASAVDLTVVRGGVLAGQVIDARGAPVAGAVVRARGNALRPALGTDVAETDSAGRFALHLAPGAYVLDATHERYAGIAGTSERMVVEPAAKRTTTLTLAAGCVIAGRVLDARGNPAGDGAIEKRWGATDLEFGPAGRIASDGTFRWVTTDEADVTLRAWPWKSPPSQSRTFSCRDGARFTNVVLQLDDRRPDIEGTLTDEHGVPVPFAFVDLTPQDPGGISQQERTDADGRWQVFNMPPGRYRITASAAGHGVVAEVVTAPIRDVALQLGGVGRIEGTTTLLANGTFELTDVTCADAARRGGIPIAQQHRLVHVAGGRFTIDDVPACTIWAQASWRDQHTRIDIEVPVNAAATLELDLGPPHAKTVHGTVRDPDGRPAANVLVTAAYKTKPNAFTRTDDIGHFTLQTYSGATLAADADDGSGIARVGMANVDDEEVDLTLGVGERRRGWDD